MKKEALDRVRLIFEMFDVNGNGVLEADDFELMTGRIMQATTQARESDRQAVAAAVQRYWNTLSAELDVNRDGKITFEEFTGCVLSPERFTETIAAVADSFGAVCDPDGDGLIERGDFLDMMRAVGFREENADALFEAMKRPGTDRVAVPDWAAAIEEYYSPEKAGIVGDRLVPDAATRA